MKNADKQVFVWKSIERIEAVPYDGPVFNLQVDGPACFVAEGVVVHNCPHHGRPLLDRKLTREECAGLWTGG